MADVLILSRTEVESLLTLEAIVPVIEQAFVDFDAGRTVAYPVVREFLGEHRGVFGIKSGYLMNEEVIGLKAGGFWLGNPDLGLTSHQSTTVMFDPRTGQPTAFMDGNHITGIRTAAVGALAARELARKDSSIATILGCGMQGMGQIEALCSVRPIESVRAFDLLPDKAEQLAGVLRARGLEALVCGDAESAVRGADIVVTTTPAKEPVLKADWIEPGVHISAFGADTSDKNEVDAELFQKATVIVDDIAQAITIGDTHHAVERGLVEIEDIDATLGEILGGRMMGRVTEEAITVFDATGLAFQDLVAAQLAVDLAEERGVGTRLSLV
jgi:alanine dehydrogenase